MSPTRRAVIAGGLASLALAPGLPALAFGPRSKIDIAELDLGSGTLSRPEAWKRLLYDVIFVTAVECEPRSAYLSPEDPALFEHPFAVLIGDGAFALPSEKGLEQLSRYLAYGGFLLIDDVAGSDSAGFDRSVRRLANALFPTRPLSPLPALHSIYRAFFLLDEAVGRVALHPFLQGITVGNVAPVIYSRNDLSGALERRDGMHVHACVPGGERQRREAVKLGVNLVLYSLTANYKRDQAHVKTLIEEGRVDWTE